MYIFSTVTSIISDRYARIDTLIGLEYSSFISCISSFWDLHLKIYLVGLKIYLPGQVMPFQPRHLAWWMKIRLMFYLSGLLDTRHLYQLGTSLSPLLNKQRKFSLFNDSSSVLCERPWRIFTSYNYLRVPTFDLNESLRMCFNKNAITRPVDLNRNNFLPVPAYNLQTEPDFRKYHVDLILFPFFPMQYYL